MADGRVGVSNVEGFQRMESGSGVQALRKRIQVQAGGQGPGAKVRSSWERPKNSMDASKETCHERRERVKAFGMDVVPEVRPIRKVLEGSPSASSSLPVAGTASSRSVQ
jgi:hypothetical protein